MHAHRLAIFVFAGVSHTAVAQTVFPLTGGTVQGQVDHPLQSNFQVTPITLPGPGEAYASLGATWCRAAYEFTSTTSVGALTIATTQRAAYPVPGLNRSIMYGDPRFRVTEPTPFTIAGLYKALDTEASGLHMEVALFAGPTIVFQHTADRNGVGVSVTIGVAGAGDTLFGSPEGVLIPNVDYMLALNWRLDGSQSPGFDAAEGVVTVSVGAVPAPAGLVALLPLIRRRRRAIPG